MITCDSDTHLQSNHLEYITDQIEGPTDASSNHDYPTSIESSPFVLGVSPYKDEYVFRIRAASICLVRLSQGVMPSSKRFCDAE